MPEGANYLLNKGKTFPCALRPPPLGGCAPHLCPLVCQSLCVSWINEIWDRWLVEWEWRRLTEFLHWDRVGGVALLRSVKKDIVQLVVLMVR